MRFMCISYADQASEAGVPPSEEMMTRMGAFMEDVTKAGVLLSAEGLHPTARGAKLKYADGKLTVTDGPFTESKEIVAGWAIVQVDSMDEAIEWSRRFFAVLGEGEGEIRQIFDADDFGPEFAPGLREQEERQRGQMAANQEATS